MNFLTRNEEFSRNLPNAKLGFYFSKLGFWVGVEFKFDLTEVVIN